MKKRYVGPLVVIILMAAGVFLWFKEGQLPVNPTDKTIHSFVIEQGQSMNVIINDLQKQDLIRNRVVFYALIKKLGIERSIQAGEYRLTKAMTATEIAENLTHGTRDTWVTVVEGLRKEEIAQLFAKSHNIKELDFILEAQEGMLFPDTYLLPSGITAKDVVATLLSNFEQKARPVLRQAGVKNLNSDEILVLASLIEREAKSYEDRQMVAGILLNRIDDGMPLQVDATVQYALGFDETTNSWWKKDLTFEDLKVNSPYNTYENAGLPPGPICNPGLDAIRAVINETPSDYLYYLTDEKGVMHYGKTLEEHNQNIKKYL
ncbi:MAG: endolytic transglycosylase MltG [Patescibacteria group bacterium]|jgi:UPF0755 protein